MNTPVSHSLSRISYEPVAGREFTADSVVAELYRFSLPYERTHFEGALCIKGLLGLVADYRRDGVERVSDEVLVQRVDAYVDFARIVLATLSEVEAVVLYGSAIRGKVTPGDLDLRLVTKFSKHDDIDLENPRMNAIQEKVSKDFKNSPSIPQKVDGLEASIFVDSEFRDRTGISLDYVMGGPYLVVMRGRSRDGVAVFLNTSGREYLRNKRP